MADDRHAAKALLVADSSHTGNVQEVPAVVFSYTEGRRVSTVRLLTMSRS